jgi:hypothetical protein
MLRTTRIHSGAVWKDHSKHVFVLTSAGKPVFSRYGNEMEQTAITSVITAIVGRTLDTADPIKCVGVGATVLHAGLADACVTR